MITVCFQRLPPQKSRSCHYLYFLWPPLGVVLFSPSHILWESIKKSFLAAIEIPSDEESRSGIGRRAQIWISSLCLTPVMVFPQPCLFCEGSPLGLVV